MKCRNVDFLRNVDICNVIMSISSELTTVPINYQLSIINCLLVDYIRNDDIPDPYCQLSSIKCRNVDFMRNDDIPMSLCNGFRARLISHVVMWISCEMMSAEMS